MGGCLRKPAVKDELEAQLPVKTKKVACKQAPMNTAPAAKHGASVATIPYSSPTQTSSKLGVCYSTNPVAAGTTKIDASKVAPGQEAFSLVLLEEEPAEAGKTTAREVVRGQVLDISPGSLQEKPAPPQPKPTIREVRCQENIDNLLSQLAVVEARKQRLKAEKEHACAADRAAIARQLNAGKKDKARLQRALDKARAELALAGIDRLPELHEDFRELRTLGKGNWGEVVEVACNDLIGELHIYALKRALVPAGDHAAADASAEPPARAAGSFRGASAKAAPVESGALELPGAVRCIQEEAAEEDAGEEAAEEVEPAGVEEVELWDTREAAKHLSARDGTYDARQALHTEGAFLSTIGPHPGIIGCLGWVGPDRSALLLELARFGTLDICLWGKKQRGRQQWTATQKLRISLQCVRAARHIHAAGAVHRDIKPQNTLMVARTDAWLADFGMACWASEAGRCRRLAGSVAYSINPLSVEDFSAAGIQDDTWAIGLLIWCIHTRRDMSTIQGYQMLALEKCDARKEDLERMQARCRELGLPEGNYCYELLVAQTLGLAGLDAPGMENNALTTPLPGEPKMPEAFMRMLRRATRVEAWRAQPVTLHEWEECLVSCLREAEEAKAKARMGCGIRWRF